MYVGITVGLDVGVAVGEAEGSGVGAFTKYVGVRLEGAALG